MTTTTDDTSRLVLRIDGMHCAGCVNSVERVLQSVEGVVGARVSLVTHQAQVVAEPRTQTEELVRAVESVGFAAELDDFKDSGHLIQLYDRQQQHWRMRLIAAAVLMSLMLVNHFVPGSSLASAVQLILAAAFLFGVGWPMLSGGIRQLIRLHPDMDSLIGIGTTAAFAAGVYGWLVSAAMMTLLDVGMILSFITLGRFLESTTRRSATRAMSSLLDLIRSPYRSPQFPG